MGKQLAINLLCEAMLKLWWDVFKLEGNTTCPRASVRGNRMELWMPAATRIKCHSQCASNASLGQLMQCGHCLGIPNVAMGIRCVFTIVALMIKVKRDGVASL